MEFLISYLLPNGKGKDKPLNLLELFVSCTESHTRAMKRLGVQAPLRSETLGCMKRFGEGRHYGIAAPLEPC
jgi:hypothetical protein